MNNLKIQAPFAVQRELDLKLVAACQNKSRGGIERYMTLGASPTCRTKSGSTLIHWAATNLHDDPTVLKELLSNGAPVDFDKGHDGWKMTPLHHAAKRGKSQCCLALISFGANINAVNSYGQKPIHSACSYSVMNEKFAIKTSSVLIDAGADINSRSKMDTPLTIAAQSGWPLLFKSLIEKGAQYDGDDWLNKRLEDSCNVANKGSEIKSILQSYIAKSAMENILIKQGIIMKNY